MTAVRRAGRVAAATGCPSAARSLVVKALHLEPGPSRALDEAFDRALDWLRRTVGLERVVRCGLSPPTCAEPSPAASVLQASGFRSDVTLFRLNARPRQKTGSLSAFRRNTAERVYIIEAAHNPEVIGSNPAPATTEARHKRASCVEALPPRLGYECAGLSGG